MKKIQEELFKLARKYDSSEIDEKNFNLSFIAILQNNNAAIKGQHISALVDFILNEQVFEISDFE